MRCICGALIFSRISRLRVLVNLSRHGQHCIPARKRFIGLIAEDFLLYWRRELKIEKDGR